MVRIKHRYLLIKILYPEHAKSRDQQLDTTTIYAPTPDTFDSLALVRLIRRHVAELFGDYGIGVIGGHLIVKYLSPATSTAIIRCPRDHYRLVWAALSTVTELPRPKEEQKGPTRSCVFRVVRVSGTIRKVEEEAIRWAKRQIWQAKNGEADASDGILRAFAEHHDPSDAQERSNTTRGIEDSGSEMDEHSDG